uniref:Uncharacterized protein n=1 Tax=viral metagenome TaxID=1070528 RepID=A0A6C0ITQ1_9ZZZZ
MSSTTTNYKVNLVDLSNVFIPLVDNSYTLIPSSAGLPNGIYSSCCAVSGNGAIMVIGAGNSSVFIANPLYISTNYGVTWTTASGVPSLYWTCVSCSQSGQYIAAGTYTMGGPAPQIYVSSNYGSTWSLITSLPTNPTSGVPINYGGPVSISSISINNAGLLLVSSYYNGVSPNRQFLFYSNNLSTWNLEQLQGYTNIALYIPSCKISNNSTNIFTPEFMCCVTQSNSGYIGGIWIYTIGNPIWTNYGSTAGLYQSIDISNDGKYGVVGLNNSVSSSLYLSSNYGQTWMLSNSPNTNLIANVCINSTGSTICYNNFIISYNYGYSWTILPSIPISTQLIWLSYSYNSNKALLVSLDGTATTTGCYIYNLNPTNQLTKYLVNGIDLSNIFTPQLTDLSNSFIITNYNVCNFVPCWTPTIGTYDLGQVFQNSQPFIILSGTYTLSSLNNVYTVTFSTPGNASIYIYNTVDVSYTIVGSGAGGHSGINSGTTGGSGGAGGGGGQVLQGSLIASNNCTINLAIGSGGLGTAQNPSGPLNGNISSLDITSQSINITSLGGSINNSQGSLYNVYNGGTGGNSGAGQNGSGGISSYGGGGGGGGGGNIASSGGSGVNGGGSGGHSGTATANGQGGGGGVRGGGGGGGGSPGTFIFSSFPGGNIGGNGIIILTISINQ